MGASPSAQRKVSRSITIKICKILRVSKKIRLPKIVNCFTKIQILPGEINCRSPTRFWPYRRTKAEVAAAFLVDADSPLDEPFASGAAAPAGGGGAGGDALGGDATQRDVNRRSSLLRQSLRCHGAPGARAPALRIEAEEVLATTAREVAVTGFR